MMHPAWFFHLANANRIAAEAAPLLSRAFAPSSNLADASADLDTRGRARPPAGSAAPSPQHLPRPSLDRRARAAARKFPHKLYAMLEYAAESEWSAAACWSDDGKSFSIKDREALTRLLPCFFKQSKFSSFNRQLNLWGFTRTSPDSWCHEHFLRGEVLRLNDIAYVKVKGGTKGDGPKKSKRIRQEYMGRKVHGKRSVVCAPLDAKVDPNNNLPGHEHASLPQTGTGHPVPAAPQGQGIHNGNSPIHRPINAGVQDAASPAPAEAPRLAAPLLKAKRYAASMAETERARGAGAAPLNFPAVGTVQAGCLLAREAASVAAHGTRAALLAQLAIANVTDGPSRDQEDTLQEIADLLVGFSSRATE